MEREILSQVESGRKIVDEILRSSQNETEALREIIRQKEMVIKALKDHSLCLRTSFKEVLLAVLD